MVSENGGLTAQDRQLLKEVRDELRSFKKEFYTEMMKRPTWGQLLTVFTIFGVILGVALQLA